MTWVVLSISLVAGAAQAADGPSVQRRFDDAREHFLTGYYRHAFEGFSVLAGGSDSKLAASAGIAMADCQMAWGDYEGALGTLSTKSCYATMRRIETWATPARSSSATRPC